MDNLDITAEEMTTLRHILQKSGKDELTLVLRRDGVKVQGDEPHLLDLRANAAIIELTRKLI